MVITDSANHTAYASMTVVTRIEREEYTVTINAPVEFLTNPTTVYPVTVDPTLTINEEFASDPEYYEAAIEDLCVCDGTEDPNYDNIATIGAYETGETIGSSFFYSENYDIVYATSPYEVKAANWQFIDDALTQGKTIYCSHDPIFTLQNYPYSAYAAELNMIQDYYSGLSKTVTYSKTIINGCEVWEILTGD